MSKHYPIWYDVTACIYKSDKSFGAKQTSEVDISVGSSKSNSHRIARLVTTKREMSEYMGYTDVIVFRFSVDDIVLKKAIFENKQGRAGKLLKEISKLKEVK